VSTLSICRSPRGPRVILYGAAILEARPTSLDSMAVYFRRRVGDVTEFGAWRVGRRQPAPHLPIGRTPVGTWEILEDLTDKVREGWQVSIPLGPPGVDKHPAITVVAGGVKIAGPDSEAFVGPLTSETIEVRLRRTPTALQEHWIGGEGWNELASPKQIRAARLAAAAKDCEAAAQNGGA